MGDSKQGQADSEEVQHVLNEESRNMSEDNLNLVFF